MSKRSIWLIISLMAIALIGISAFQIYWINNVIQLSRERFEKDALASMQLVADRLEKNEMLNVATNSFAFFGTSSFDSGGANFTQDLIFTTDKDSAFGRFRYRTNSNKNVKVIVRGDSSRELREFVSDTATSIIEVKVVNGVRENIDVARRLNSKQKVLTKVVEEMMLHEVKRTNRVHPMILDSMLRYEFKNHGIHINYEFGIYDSRDNEFRVVRAKNKEKLSRQALKATLFPNDILNNGLSLMVNFPDKNRFLLEKVWLSLLVSFLFILVIITVFSYVVYKVIHQKKLADLKNDFINNMTHEFKTPIATVTLATEALSESTVQSDTRMRERYLGVIKEESARLSGQVEKVLQLATIEQNELTLRKSTIGVNSLVTAAAERIEFQIEEATGSLSLELPDEDIQIFADENHFTNALFNLLDNALKYSKDTPHIGISVKKRNTELMITVADQGIGLSKEQQRLVFDKFYRVPTGNLHDVKGFGLGLNYVKYISEAHHGRIEVESEPDQGSRFTIVLNLQQHGL